MIRLLIFIIICLLGSLGLKANDQFDQAVVAYQEQKFEESLKLFESLEQAGRVSEELYFNIANCYLKLNELAPSILYYERALKIDPNFSEAKFNLNKAKAYIKEEVVPTKSFFLKTILNQIVWIMSATFWLLISVFCLCIGVFIYYLYVKNEIKPLGYSPYTWLSISAALAILMLIFSYQAHAYKTNQDYAIYMKTEGSLMQSPSTSSEHLLPISAGLKCLIMDRVDEWVLIRLEDYQQGWVKKDDLNII